MTKKNRQSTDRQKKKAKATNNNQNFQKTAKVMAKNSNKCTQLSNEHIINYLKYVYFGNISQPYIAAGNRAYRDFCRTIDFETKETENRETAKSKIYSYLQDELENLKITSHTDYDKWHNKVCKKVIVTFCKEADLHYGQAQKWLNMTLKYLLILEEPNVVALTPFLHVPIDNAILAIAKDVKHCSKPWSQWCYEDYTKYQNDLKSLIEKESPSTPPIIWELINWKPTKVLYSEKSK